MLESGEKRCHDARRRNSGFVPPNEFAGPIAPTVRRREQRPLLEIALDVRGELRHRGITAGGFFAHRHTDNVVQIALQLARFDG